MAIGSQTSTQKFVPIRDIKDGVVILKNGQMCSILLATSINFALKSADEQRATLAQFQATLNTYEFSVQYYVQSRRLNIQPYLELLASREDAQYSDLMRIQLREYIDFIRTFTTEVDIMSKNFFVVVPYSPGKMTGGDGLAGGIGKLLKSKQRNTVDTRFEEDRTQLNQRVGIVEQGLNRIGIKTVALGDQELVELYYYIFNPAEADVTANI